MYLSIVDSSVTELANDARAWSEPTKRNTSRESRSPGASVGSLYSVRRLTRATKVERTRVTRLMNRPIDFAPVRIMPMTQCQQLLDHWPHSAPSEYHSS